MSLQEVSSESSESDFVAGPDAMDEPSSSDDDGSVFDGDDASDDVGSGSDEDFGGDDSEGEIVCFSIVVYTEGKPCFRR